MDFLYALISLLTPLQSSVAIVPQSKSNMPDKMIKNPQKSSSQLR
ncbi:hypothetical protein WDC_0186 [Paucilactobacillus wasatchensis]|uniref:Uncharacterized protein n=1 Tax=Paucilactobacillus wasatchensis TaxID=1335616 RepID=A0A0D1A8V0_9LACO|nr:hypothetical protein WDC_0186 [Paucilactobacillus wasatchensis]